MAFYVQVLLYPIPFLSKPENKKPPEMNSGGLLLINEQDYLPDFLTISSIMSVVMDFGLSIG